MTGAGAGRAAACSHAAVRRAAATLVLDLRRQAAEGYWFAALLAGLMVGADQRHLLGWSLLAGPLLLLAADVVGRVLVRPAELEAGVVTAFIGAPVLIGLALGRRSA